MIEIYPSLIFGSELTQALCLLTIHIYSPISATTNSSARMGLLGVVRSLKFVIYVIVVEYEKWKCAFLKQAKQRTH